MAEQAKAGVAIAASRISKSFGGALALTDVDLLVHEGECHAVVGENGAGKSTLMRVLCGLIAPDAGSVTCFGQPISPNPGSARAAGIALVHQERSLLPDLTVAENISLGRTPTRAGFVRRKELNSAAEILLQRVGLKVTPNTRLGLLSSAQQQMVEIAKALSQDPRVLILDEPSASLTPRETEGLLDMLKSLAQTGIAIVYISHRLPEIYALCATTTVLRDGRVVGSFELANTPAPQLVKLMVGRALAQDLKVSHKGRPGTVVLSAEHLESAAVKDVSLKVHAGEIVGIGGLVGAGRTEIVRTILGIDARTSGTVTVTDKNGQKKRIDSYRDALRHGVSYVPEDRRGEGVLIDMSIEMNVALPNRNKTSRFGVGLRRKQLAVSEDVIERVDVSPKDGRAEVGRLSGGNQQKVAFGKWLPTNPRLFVMDEPTRGVDVGAKAQIHDLVRELADDGVAVLVVSSDLPELLALSDRVIVVRDGRIVGELSDGDLTAGNVMAVAVGQEAEVGADA